MVFTKLWKKQVTKVINLQKRNVERCISGHQIRDYLNVSADHPVTSEQLLIVTIQPGNIIAHLFLADNFRVAIYLYCTLFFNLGESDLNCVGA